MIEISQFYTLCIEISNEAVECPGRLWYSNLEIALSSIYIASREFNNSDFPYNMYEVLEGVYKCNYYHYNNAIKFVAG